MALFNAISNVVFLSLFTYHVISFGIQYLITRRLEFLYYSLYLLCGSVYYFLFFNSALFQANATAATSNVSNCLRMTIALFQIFVYTLFTVTYLGITHKHKWIYQFFRAYLVFVPSAYALCLFMYFLQVDAHLFLAVFYCITIPVLLVYFFAISQLMTLHSNIYLAGTVLNMIGTIISFLTGVYWKHSGVNHHVPAQIGLLLDLFILGYGLSLKAAETDKKLVASLLQNQEVLEIERNRLARQLHDGLGGMLSGIKQSLNADSSQLILPETTAPLLTRALTQLDNAISEMRRIAHSMIPEALLKFGLQQAIQNYCTGINQSGKVKMKFTPTGLQQPIEQTIQTSVYLVVQELCNNAIKHAQAKTIIIQLATNENRLNLTVEDDGKGFDPQETESRKGAGLQNVQSRVDYMKGTLQIKTQAGKGTCIQIEI